MAQGSQLSVAFSICPRCRRLCMLSPSSKCKVCATDYQQVYLMRKQGYSQDIIIERLKMKRERLAMLGELESTPKCTVCNEPLRGYKHDTLGQRNDQVCPYCYAMAKRIDMMNMGMLKRLFTYVQDGQLRVSLPETKPVMSDAEWDNFTLGEGTSAA